MQPNVDYDKIVCDNGTGYLKLGYAGDSFPRYSIPSIVGRPMLRSNQKIGDFELKEVMYGDEAAPFRALLDIKYPITEGKIANWDDFSALWEYAFKTRMGIKDLSTKKLLVTEAALNPKKNREKMAEYIFEKHGFGACMFES
jgi:actin-related protein 2